VARNFAKSVIRAPVDLLEAVQRFERVVELVEQVAELVVRAHVITRPLFYLFALFGLLWRWLFP